jgi:hypothetical protein
MMLPLLRTPSTILRVISASSASLRCNRSYLGVVLGVLASWRLGVLAFPVINLGRDASHKDWLLLLVFVDADKLTLRLCCYIYFCLGFLA